MQARNTGIILSLGMLLDNVDTNAFIGKLIGLAKQKNSEFDFNQELQKRAFGLSAAFNRGKLDAESFKSQILELLGNPEIESKNFWQEWNRMVSIGKLGEKIQFLQEIQKNHHVLIYLVSDTNLVHLAEISKLCAVHGIVLNMPRSSFVEGEKQPMMLDCYPLYASCEIGKDRHELTKHIVSDIRSKQFNKLAALILVLGNPENIQHPAHKLMAQAECKQITEWCAANDVTVQLHNNNLQETFEHIFKPVQEDVSTARIKLG